MFRRKRVEGEKDRIEFAVGKGGGGVPLSIYRDQRQRGATLISPLQRDAGNSHVQVSNVLVRKDTRKSNCGLDLDGKQLSTIFEW